MNITEIRISPVTSTASPSLKAFATITIDNAIAIHDIAIRENEEGLYITMPSRKMMKNGEEAGFMNIVHPISKSVRNTITNAILSIYNAQT